MIVADSSGGEAAEAHGAGDAVPALPAATARAPDLVDIAVESDTAANEQAVLALATAKRHDGQSFLGDFSCALQEHATHAEGQLFQDVFAAFIARFRRDGFFVEVGTGDGKLISNTYMLEKKLGWSGLVVEPNPSFLPALRQNRTCAISTDCVYDVSGRTVTFMCTADPEFSRIRDGNADLHDARRAEEFTQVELTTVSLNELLDKNNCPPVIDYLSLDVEGPEFEILQTFDFTARTINCITVEHNWTQHQEQIHDLLTANGFVRVFDHLSQWDDWYVRRDVLAGFPAAADLVRAGEESEPGPGDANTFVRWALEALERGEPQVAEALCAQAIAIDPGSGSARRTLATVAVIQGRRTLAVERWRDAVAQDPSDYWARIGLAELLATRGAIGEAVANLREAVALTADNQRAQDMLAALEPKLAARPS